MMISKEANHELKKGLMPKFYKQIHNNVVS